MFPGFVIDQCCTCSAFLCDVGEKDQVALFELFMEEFLMEGEGLGGLGVGVDHKGEENCGRRPPD